MWRKGAPCFLVLAADEASRRTLLCSSPGRMMSEKSLLTYWGSSEGMLIDHLGQLCHCSHPFPPLTACILPSRPTLCPTSHIPHPPLKACTLPRPAPNLIKALGAARGRPPGLGVPNVEPRGLADQAGGAKPPVTIADWLSSYRMIRCESSRARHSSKSGCW